jgi:hypothetical protein
MAAIKPLEIAEEQCMGMNRWLLFAGPASWVLELLLTNRL